MMIWGIKFGSYPLPAQNIHHIYLQQVWQKDLTLKAKSKGAKVLDIHPFITQSVTRLIKSCSTLSNSSKNNPSIDTIQSTQVTHPQQAMVFSTGALIPQL